MNDTIHVKVQVIKFLAVRVWLRGVDRNLDTVDLRRLVFYYHGREFGVFVGEPPATWKWGWERNFSMRAEILWSRLYGRMVGRSVPEQSWNPHDS
ncbi:hypothetical protein BC938DRAFT_477044 [Jimgerdemannia flammicorona]|uniref:Uncharacterized protein n=1 Tax=Jimgerdemannia flammicorona TaxID=994334 RepID=A0A433PCH5_9FUNG|nr:hypothetical protein BC938DRAFT_477044 [Jimgerdemannia flammicorona]